tara:strand:+ start:2546 stop:4303 length:1758 start_codon:yes stop_codon:yes gene_type:complete
MAEDTIKLEDMTLPQLKEYHDTVVKPAARKGVAGAAKQLDVVRNLAETKFRFDLFSNKSLIPASETMSGGDIAKDIGMAGTKGAVSSITGTADLPAYATQGALAGIDFVNENVLGREPTSDAFKGAFKDTLRGAFPLVGDLYDFTEPQAGKKAEELMPSVMNYEPQTEIAKVSERVMEFLPFAGKNVITMGVLPAVTSYYAGEMKGVKGTPLQLPVEIATAVFSPSVAKAVVSPRGGELTGITKKYVDKLQKEKVVPSAGQIFDDDQLKAYESATRQGRDYTQQAYDNFSRAALKRIGIASDRADEKDLERVYREMGKIFDNTIGSLQTTGSKKIVPSKQQIDEIIETITEYRSNQPQMLAKPIYGQILNAFKRSYETGQSLSGNQIKRFHRLLNKNTRLGNEDGDLARDVLPIVKQMIFDNLGEEAKKAFIANNRRYRDFIAIEKTLERGDGLYEGIVYPLKLANATQAVYKRENLFGKSDLGQLSKAGASVMKRLPQSGTAPRSGGMAGNQDALRGGAAGFMLDPSDPNVALAGGLLGSGVPFAKSRLMGRPDVQEYMKNQLIGRQGEYGLLRMLGASTLPDM